MITPLQTAAADALRYFEVAERTDGTRYDRLTDDAPEWLRAAVRQAHMTELPNDWRHDIACSVVQAIANGDLRDDDGIHEFADSATDPYTADLLRWLADSVERIGYLDMVRAEYGPADCFATELNCAQYHAIRDTAHIMLDAMHRYDLVD